MAWVMPILPWPGGYQQPSIEPRQLKYRVFEIVPFGISQRHKRLQKRAGRDGTGGVRPTDGDDVLGLRVD